MTDFTQTDGTTTVCTTAAFCTGNVVNAAQTVERESSEGGTAGTGSVNITIDFGANNENAVTYTVLDGTNNLEDLDGATGNWTFRKNITSARKSHTWTGIAACRVNSSCVNQETICNDQTISIALDTTGIKTATVNQASVITMGATDRIAIVSAYDSSETMNNKNHIEAPDQNDSNQWAPTGGGDVFFENRHQIEQGYKANTAAGSGGVLIE